jgi:hypothetical protein
MTNETSTAYFVQPNSCRGVKIPDSARKNTSTGISKQTPKARMSWVVIEKTSRIVQAGSTNSLRKLAKNVNTAGNTSWCANTAPPMNKELATPTNGSATLLSAG